MKFGAPHASGLLLALLAACVALLRLQDAPDRNTQALGRTEGCVGVTRPDGFFGLVCGTKDALAERAHSDLQLPTSCASSAISVKHRRGAHFVFGKRDGKCVLLKSEVLRGAARLSAGLALDVNQENTAGLVLLPGIGPVKAAAIVEERSSGGAFRDGDDLTRVKGIGAATVKRLLPFIEFTGAQSGSK